VQSNTYAAEFGGSGGGVVNVVTKSGTNSYHGAAFEFLRNSEFDAQQFLQQCQECGAAQVSSGISLGRLSVVR